MRSDQSGSVIAGAAAFIVVLGLVVAAAATRSMSLSAGAVGAHDRSQARTAAEQGLWLALMELESPETRRDLLARRTVDRLLLDESPTGVDGRVEPQSVVAHGRSVGGRTDIIEVSAEAVVGSATASAHARVRPLATSDFALLTEHRAVDPALLGVPRVACVHPIGHPARDARCRDADLGLIGVDGPVHMNEFDASVSSAVEALATTSSLAAGATEHRAELVMPRTAQKVIGVGPVTCRFRGPTIVRFDGPAVRVRSPRTAPRAGESIDAASPLGCMHVERQAFTDFVTVELPERAVIEVVRDDDSSCFSHPLGLAAEEAVEWICDGGDAFIWGRYRGARTVLAEDNVQIVWDLEPGDATGSALLEHGDVLGVVAGDSIVLRRPVSAATWVFPRGRNVAFAGPWSAPFGAYPLDAPSSSSRTWDAPRIVASLAALRGSVTIQNLARGQASVGRVSVVGSVASRFAPTLGWEHVSDSGAVLATTGYGLEVHYDVRLDAAPPPLMPMIDGGRVRILELDVG